MTKKEKDEILRQKIENEYISNLDLEMNEEYD